MKIISNAHFAEVRAFDDVKIGSWRNRFSARGKEPYKTLPGLFVLADAKLEDFMDLQRRGRQ
jgi:hypothetical protein